VNSIIFITGPAGSGKTTIARQVAQHFPKSLHIQVDHLREMMVNGVELPSGGGWNEEVGRQFRLARTTAIYMAKLYAANGVEVVIDDVCVPPEFAEDYATLFDDPAVKRVLLLPTAAALVERMNKRAGPYDKFLVGLVPWFYSYLEPMPKEGWLVLDTSERTVEQTVRELLEGIGQG
jgi:predicted kinase